MADDIHRASTKLGRWAPQIVLRCVSRIVRWAAQDRRLYSLGRRLLRRSPALRARIGRLIMQEMPGGPAAASKPQHLSRVELAGLPESARTVLQELRAAIRDVGTRRQP